MQQKSNIKDVIDGLIDSNGIKTEVTLTLTQKTLFRIVIALLISGVSILSIVYLTKHLFPNKQLAGLEKEIIQIKTLLKK